MAARKLTPQEKKSLSYTRDSRYVPTLEPHIGARSSHISKQKSHRSERHRINQVLGDAPGLTEYQEDFEAKFDAAVSAPRPRWEHAQSAPLGQLVHSRADPPEISSLAGGRICFSGNDVPGGASWDNAVAGPGFALPWPSSDVAGAHVFMLSAEHIKAFMHLRTQQPKTLILGMGFGCNLEVEPAVFTWAEDNGMEVICLPTEQAVELYNDTRYTNKPMAVLHGACSV